MLAKGFVLSKDALNLARSFDERHNILSNATATVASLDRQYGLSEKINLGRAIVGSKVKEVDERYQVSELTKSALAAAEQKASFAGSAILSNQYVSAGASWLTSAFGMVTKAAGDMTSMAKDKVERAEEERKAIMWEERNGLVSDYAKIHLDEPSSWEPAVLPLESVDEQKLQAVWYTQTECLTRNSFAARPIYRLFFFVDAPGQNIQSHAMSSDPMHWVKTNALISHSVV